MKNIVFFVLAFICGSANAQLLQPKKISSEIFSADIYLGADKFGYQYGIRDNVFFKFKDTESTEYKNLTLGKISRVDLQNPLKIVLFYEGFNTIITLDNQLNETQKINFSDTATPIVVTATGMASQNRFWVYDSLTQQIGLYNYLSNKYIPITQPLQGTIKYYETDFNYFQWTDDKNNWYACDVFGKITTMGKIPDSDLVQIITPQLLLFSKDGSIYFQDYKNNKKYTVENVEKSFKSFSYKEQILSIFTTEGIMNYKITIP